MTHIKDHLLGQDSVVKVQKRAVRVLPTAVWELPLAVFYVTGGVIARILTDYQVYGIAHQGVKGFQSRPNRVWRTPQGSEAVAPPSAV